ncbi:MAG: chemotaxis-specific protein-glutamate methyltransferase CheB [Spirochaetaceae bacterium]|jgi:two-component system chemotaxis response regulator CheB|nr:chemotaxis-specific protein-glutamate methyltransferase CheB [Spirochaetaceae bacterium]
MINTLIVDDSAMVRDIIRDFLEGDGNFTIIGEAADGEEGVQKILSLNPDLVTLDIEMPKLNGLEVIERVMEKSHVPIVVITSQDTAQTAYEATLRGALEFYSKDLFTASLSPAKRGEIYETLKRISGIKARRNFSVSAAEQPDRPEKRKINVVVIAASTGGPKALSRALSLLPADFPVPIAVVQHNSPGFDRGFAQWLNAYTALEIKLAEDREILRPGKVYIAPTGTHLAMEGLEFYYDHGEPENNQKPAADVLFRTAAESLKDSVISVVLTGMGCDGARGTRRIREMGGVTLAQDEGSSLIYGMPKAAVETGFVDLVLPLDRIPRELEDLVGSTG